MPGPAPRRTRRRPTLAALAAVATALVAGGSALALAAGDDGAIGPQLALLNNGRHLTPYGRTTAVGNAPMGGAATPDGRFYWTVSRAPA
jgi:hypothetical protein